MYIMGHIDINIYKCVSDDIVTDEVIITNERIEHIKNNHPNDFEVYCGYLKSIIESPEYIIEANKPNTALVLKEFEKDGKRFKTVLRLHTSIDDPSYKNSVITFMRINAAEWGRLLRNKKNTLQERIIVV